MNVSYRDAEHGNGAYASTDDLHRQGQRGHVDPASNGLVSREKGYGCPDKWRAQSLGALRKCAQVLHRPGAYAEISNPYVRWSTSALNHTRQCRDRSRTALRIWARELKAEFMAFFSLKPSASCLKKLC